MFNKLLTCFSLTTALLTTMDFSFAMEPEEGPQRVVTKYSPIDLEFVQQQMRETFAIRKIEEAKTLRCQTNSMKDSIQKAANFGKVASLMEASVPFLDDPEMKETLTQSVAFTLKAQAGVLHNIGLPTAGNPTVEQLSFLKQAVESVRKSYKIYSALVPTPEHQKEAQNSQTLLDEILVNLSLTCSLMASKEQDFVKIIGYHSQALKAAKESYTIQKTPHKKNEFKMQLLLALRQSLGIYKDIVVLNTVHFKSDASPKSYKILIDNSEILKNILVLFETYLLNSPLGTEWFIEVDGGVQKNQQRVKTKERNLHPNNLTINPAVFKNFPPILDPNECLTLFWSTYCGTLKGASNMALKFNTSNECLNLAYHEKGRTHLQNALETYKKNVYKAEYEKDSNAFILARLEDLAGNEKPRKEFYAKLRQERKKRQEQVIAQKILVEKEAMKKEAENLRAAEELKAAQLQTLQEKKSKEDSMKTNETIGSVPFVESMIQPLRVSETTEVLQRKPRVKTHGNADPSRAQHKPISNNLVRQTNDFVDIEPMIVLLSPKNYNVFLGLTGESLNRSISLPQVKTLLGALSCKITEAGGSHQKATAPNNKMWTIPPEWNGPIPDYYRLQLMHFLFNDMEIDPDSVKKKNS